MIQIKLTEEQYWDLYFALDIARYSKTSQAKNVRDLGMPAIADEIEKDAENCRTLQTYIQNTKEVI